MCVDSGLDTWREWRKDWLVKRRVGSDVRGVRLRGRPRMGWMDGWSEKSVE